VTGVHYPALSRLGLPAGAAAAFESYLDLMAAWNARVNLTGASDPETRVQWLVAEVLPSLSWTQPGPLLDIGSGNGSPGLILALLRPGEGATLLEPRTKRWAFLREAVRTAGRPDIEVLRLRHDEYVGPPATNVTLRGLALSLGSLAALAAPRARLLVFGGQPEPEAPFALEAEAPLPRSRLHVFRRDCST
jgi:16S rRNA G527 N7-methylase RsmG